MRETGREREGGESILLASSLGCLCLEGGQKSTSTYDVHVSVRYPQGTQKSACTHGVPADRYCPVPRRHTSSTLLLLQPLSLLWGHRWRRIDFPATAPIPAPRSGHQMAVYAAGEQIFLYGGYSKVSVWVSGACVREGRGWCGGRKRSRAGGSCGFLPRPEVVPKPVVVCSFVRVLGLSFLFSRCCVCGVRGKTQA